MAKKVIAVNKREAVCLTAAWMNQTQIKLNSRVLNEI